MLDKTTPAGFTALLYPLSDLSVRFHSHSEDKSLWVVAVDVCRILNITNTTYVCSRLPKDKVYKHLCYTDGGKQTVTWIEISQAIELATLNVNKDFVLWLREQEQKIKSACLSTNHLFKNPVIIERDTLNKLLEVVAELKLQNVI